jgi:hypothetical protein
VGRPEPGQTPGLAPLSLAPLSLVAEVVLPVRDQAKGDAALSRILAEAPSADVSLRELDLASLKSVEALADTLHAAGAFRGDEPGHPRRPLLRPGRVRPVHRRTGRADHLPP